MADALRHRGPDDQGYWTRPEHDIGFAHRRLSVIDLKGGRQPITNEDGTVVTIANGEIYNYRELREDLIARGHQFSTDTDTEVVVHLYEEHGTDLPSSLRGMFAIAIWDDTRRQLLLMRDRVGKKPLYYTEIDGEFLFASEIKGLVAAMRSQPTLDEQAIVDFLGFAAIPAPATIYRQLRALEPAEIAVVRDRRICEHKRYWQLQMAPKTPVSRSEAVDLIDAKLRDAVRLRLRSDVPVGCFLSGGLDSGVITAIASETYPRPLTTITVGFDDARFDERPLAKLVAQRYGTDHHEITIRPDVATDLPQIVRAYDQPYGDSSAIPSFYVARAARQLVKVVLNGDGGDETLAGYRRYVAARVSGWLAWLDGPTDRQIFRRLASALPTPRTHRSAYAFGHRLLRGLGINPTSRYLAWAVDAFGTDDLDRLCPKLGTNADWLKSTKPGDRLAKNVLDLFRTCGPLDRMLAADFLTILPNDLLVKMDIATMAHGLEARSPLLDHELVETVSRLPETLKLRGFTTKPLLRELGRRYVPPAVCKAPKRGFEVPLVRWLKEDLRELCEDTLLSRHGLLATLFDRTGLEQLLRTPDTLDPARWARRVWLLLMLGMWDRHVASEPLLPAARPSPPG
jgi:asparagine synthase (glutamine-hydrolysing)